MKSWIFVALVIAAIQVFSSGCSEGDRAYIPPVMGAVFVGPHEGWILTGEKVLKRILIDGESTRVIDAQREIEGMSFLSPAQGWTVDSKWKVQHFDGFNWTSVGHNDDNKSGLASPSNLAFVDNKTGWARTLMPLFVTDDGGKSWQKVLTTEPGELTRLFVVNKSTAFLHGDRGSVKRTTDRGQTWVDMSLADVGDVIAFACRKEGQECWAGTSHGKVFTIEGDSPPKRVPFPTPKEMTITDICPSGGDELLISGFTLIRDDNPNAYGVILKTSDGGATWTTLNAPKDDRFVKVATFGNTIWLSSNTAIYRSPDGAGSWSRIYDASKL